MNQKLIAAIVVLLMSVSFATVLSSDTSTEDWIVVLNPDVPRAAFASAYGAQVLFEYSSVFNGLAMSIPIGRTTAIAQDFRVLIMQRDGPVEAFLQTDQDKSTGWDRIEADKSDIAKIDNVDERVNVDVAILDTGVDLDHPDLNVIGPGKLCVNDALSADDDHGHGTHVAGIVAALDNRIGTVGVAPGARIHPVKVLSHTGIGTWSSVICGIDWVTANNATIGIANMSLGGTGTDDGNCGLSNNDAVHYAICKSVAAGVTYVVAAGNSAKDAKDTIPAAYNEVITVAALSDFNGKPRYGGDHWERTCVGYAENEDRIATYSNWGLDIDLIAPGTCILSTFKGKSYNWGTGTSMAAPHVSATAGLLIAHHGRTSPAQIRQELIDRGFPEESPFGYWQASTNASRQLHVPVVNADVDGGGVSEPEPQCADGIDNDVDSLIDYPQDLGCVDALDNDEDPTIAFSKPTNGANVKGLVSITMIATDATCNLRGVQFFVDGRLISAIYFSARCSYTRGYSWDSRTVPNGSHNLMAMATDLTNGVGIHRISVTVKN